MQPLVCFLVVCPSDGNMAQLTLVLHFFTIPVNRCPRHLQDNRSAQNLMVQYIVEFMLAARHQDGMSPATDLDCTEDVPDARQMKTDVGLLHT